MRALEVFKHASHSALTVRSSWLCEFRPAERGLRRAGRRAIPAPTPVEAPRCRGWRVTRPA
jgi:hypothetical protein